MENSTTSKECKVCKLTVELSNFGPRRAVCLKCSYAKNKEYLKTYYKDNRVAIIARVMEVYNDNKPIEKKPRGRPRKILKKDLTIVDPVIVDPKIDEPEIEETISRL